jgi:hypothetical protein
MLRYEGKHLAEVNWVFFYAFTAMCDKFAEHLDGICQSMSGGLSILAKSAAGTRHIGGRLPEAATCAQT